MRSILYVSEAARAWGVDDEKIDVEVQYVIDSRRGEAGWTAISLGGSPEPRMRGFLLDGLGRERVFLGRTLLFQR